MEYHSPVDTRSRPRFGIIGLLFVLTFLAGLAVAAWGARRFGWFAPDPAPVAVVQPAAPVAARPAPAPAFIPAADLATLTAREAALAAQLATLEARLGAITGDAEAAGAQAGRAEALLVAAAARRLLDRGVPLGRVEQQLFQRFGSTNPRAVEVVTAAARAPVTLEDLRLGLDAIGPELQTGSREGIWRALRREIDELVVLRRADAPRSLPVERFARARRLLDGGQVEAAVAEARTLPGAGRAGNWLLAAQRYLDARRALDVLEDAATRLPAADTVGARPVAPGPLSEPFLLGSRNEKGCRGEATHRSRLVAAVLQAAEEPLDHIAATVGSTVQRVGRTPCSYGRDHGGDVPLGEPAAESVGVLGLVGDDPLGRGYHFEQRRRHGDVGDVARRRAKGDRSAVSIGQAMDFGRAAAPRDPDRLRPLPPFCACR
jgi:hypothetical protein